jgi:catechol 2,3-dioxygenase-like lactoylglutathione lyase family enzyme
MAIRIKLCSIMVDDQDKALAFYTGVLGFQKQKDIPVAGPYRWLTVAAAGRDDIELSLEPNANPAGKTFQKALFEQGIPATAFEVSDLDAEYARLKALDVAFTKAPTQAGPIKMAVLSDTCGNLIQLYQPPSATAAR